MCGPVEIYEPGQEQGAGPGVPVQGRDSPGLDSQLLQVHFITCWVLLLSQY